MWTQMNIVRGKSGLRIYMCSGWKTQHVNTLGKYVIVFTLKHALVNHVCHNILSGFVKGSVSNERLQAFYRIS